MGTIPSTSRLFAVSPDNATARESNTWRGGGVNVFLSPQSARFLPRPAAPPAYRPSSHSTMPHTDHVSTRALWLMDRLTIISRPQATINLLSALPSESHRLVAPDLAYAGPWLSLRQPFCSLMPCRAHRVCSRQCGREMCVAPAHLCQICTLKLYHIWLLLDLDLSSKLCSKHPTSPAWDERSGCNTESRTHYIAHLSAPIAK